MSTSSRKNMGGGKETPKKSRLVICLILKYNKILLLRNSKGRQNLLEKWHLSFSRRTEKGGGQEHDASPFAIGDSCLFFHAKFFIVLKVALLCVFRGRWIQICHLPPKFPCATRRYPLITSENFRFYPVITLVTIITQEEE